MTVAVEPTTWRNRIVGSGDEDPSQLLANDKNWRIHPQGQQDALASVLDRVGWVGQVLVNLRSGKVVDGHLRVALAISRGESIVPVLYVDLSDDEESLVLASLDPISAMAATDDEKLRELIGEVTFDSPELERQIVSFLAGGRKVGLVDPDALPAPTKYYVKVGDVWQLGDHRLAVGDSTDPDLVARLLDGAAPTLLVTDPPYGVELDLSWRDEPLGSARRREGALNTSMAGDDRVDWSRAFELVLSLTCGYVWHAGVHAAEVASGLERLGFDIASQVIWDKGRFALGRGWYHWAHEPCWVVRKHGAKVQFRGKRNQGTVWRVSAKEEAHNHPTTCCEHQTTVWRAPSPKMTAGGSTEKRLDHPAQKPVVLYDHDGDVYDPFAGTGTSIIAAEQQGRRAFAVEIDPRYAQIAVDRWQEFTGRQASKVRLH